MSSSVKSVRNLMSPLSLANLRYLLSLGSDFCRSLSKSAFLGISVRYEFIAMMFVEVDVLVMNVGLAACIAPFW